MSLNENISSRQAGQRREHMGEVGGVAMNARLAFGHFRHSTYNAAVRNQVAAPATAR
jgi:hypothetical protein